MGSRRTVSFPATLVYRRRDATEFSRPGKAGTAGRNEDRMALDALYSLVSGEPLPDFRPSWTGTAD